MRKYSLLLVVSLVSMLAIRAVRADDPPLKTYVVFPLKTQLQKALAGRKSSDAYAKIDTASVLDGNYDIDPKKLGESFKSDFAAAATQSGVEKPTLALCLRFTQ